MTPARLRFIIEHCPNRGRRPLRGMYGELARFLRVTPLTVRRWLNGERAIPHPVELVLEIKFAWPSIDAAAIQRVIDARDRQEAAAD